MFKKRKNPTNIRTSHLSEDNVDSNNQDIDKEADQSDSIDWSALGEYRELKRSKMRNKNGINVLDLMSEKKKVVEKKMDKREGGLTDAKSLASELDLGNTFSLETNRRDEDAELMKYVEEELIKRRSKTDSESNSSSIAGKSNLPDDLMRVIPEHLLNISSEVKAKNEEMLSSQMLSGIPEIDLGIEERIRNIEKTEAARTKLLEERLRQKYDKSNESLDNISLAPKNLASCFTRNKNIVHQAANASNHRFNLNSIPSQNKELIEHFITKEETGNVGHKHVPKPSYEIEPVVVIGAEPQKVRMPKPSDNEKRMPARDKPTDDFFFEKFKKQLKKH